MPDDRKPPAVGARQLALLEKLSNACGLSGDEAGVRKIVLEEVRPIADEVKVDALGNVHALRRGKGRHPLRVMLAAHMDEVGLMIVEKEEGGFFRFETSGHIDVRHLVGKPVLVGPKHLPGVIGSCPPHLSTEEERSQNIKLESLRIDIGPGGGEEVKVGDRACFATRFYRAGPSLCGKALDDRLGVAGLIELLRLAPAHIELQAAFTVQEEVGLRGARVAGYALQPDLAIALDSTPANDLPAWDGEPNERYNTRLGAGPAIYVADARTISDPRLLRHLVATAEKHRIPWQLRQAGGGGTDAGAIHLSRSGVPSISVSTPIRGSHTAVSIARLEDWRNTLRLVWHALADMNPGVLAREEG